MQDEVEEWIRDLEKTVNGTYPNRAAKERRTFKSGDRLKNQWDNIQQNIIFIVGVPKGEKWEKKEENLCEEVMA